MNNGQKKLKAFTLLELIVAMAIIAVLVGLSVIGITTVQRSSRDTERLAALEAINLEVEAWYGNNGSYPSSIVFDNAADTVAVGGTVIAGGRAVTLPKGVASAINTALTATSSTETDYCYTTTAGTAYSLGVRLEGTSGRWFGTAANCAL